MPARTTKRRAAVESPTIARARRVLETEATAVQSLVERVGPEFERAVDLLLGVSGKVIVTGLGKSGIIARKVAATLASTGTPAFFVHAGEGVHGDLGMMVKGDAAIVISKDGETRELLGMLPLLKRLGVPLIALTGGLRSSLARNADLVLDVSVREEACPLALAPTASTTAALAMGDALAIAVMERRGFREKDFAFLHPAGTLGRKLLRVDDLMHRGDEMPLVPSTAILREAIVEMSAKRLGTTGVVDSAGRLIGILTDGDLRRAFQRAGITLDVRAVDVMTRHPKTIRDRALGAEAVALMEKHSITVLFIVDDRRRPKGILHLHDLLKAVVV